VIPADSDGPEVTLMYTCRGCGARDREVQVRERSNDEDVQQWMRTMIERVSADHATFSRGCSVSTCDIRIPLPRKGAPRPVCPSEFPWAAARRFHFSASV
jgi:hypothetical protein